MRAGILVLAALLPGPLRADVPRPDPPSARSIETALAALEDPDFEARGGAFQDLKAWADRFPEELLQALPEAHGDPEVSFRLDEIRRRARFFSKWKGLFAAVGDSPDAPRLRESLQALADAPSPGRVAEFAQAAGPHARLFWRAFADQLEHPDPKVRRAALRELVRTGATEVSAFIARLISDDEDYGMRLAAAEAAGELRCREAVPHLVASLTMGAPVRRVARQAIARIGDPSAVPPLVGLLDEVPDEVLKDVLCLLDLLSAADPAIAPAAAASLDDPDERIRSCAVSLLARISGEDWAKHPLGKRVDLARAWWEGRGAAR